MSALGSQNRRREDLETKHQESFEIKIPNQLSVENLTSGDESGIFLILVGLQP